MELYGIYCTNLSTFPLNFNFLQQIFERKKLCLKPDPKFTMRERPPSFENSSSHFCPLKKALTLTSSSTGLPIPPDTPALQPAACSRLRAFALAIPSGQELCSLRYGHESLTSVRSLIKCFLLREMLSDHPCEKLHPSLYPILFFSPKTFITTRHASHIYLFLSLFFIFSLQYQLQQNRIFVPFLPPTAVALGSGTRKVLDKY